MKTISLVIFSIVILFLSSTQPTKAESLTTVKLVTLLDFKPFIWCEDNEVKGIDIDILTELFSRVDRPININCHPWKRAIKYVETGEADGLFSAYMTDERKEFATYLEHPLHMSVFSVFVRKGSNITFDGIESLYGLNVGISRGYSVNPEFDEAKKQGEITTFEILYTTKGIELLQKGRIDAYVNGRIVTLNTVKEMGVSEEIIELPTPMHKPKPAYLIISKKSPLPQKEELINALNKELEQMILDGTSEEIINSYIQVAK